MGVETLIRTMMSLFIGIFCSLALGQETTNIIENITDGKARLEKQIQEAIDIKKMSRTSIAASINMSGLNDKSKTYGCNCKNLEKATEKISQASGKKELHDLSTRISVNEFDALCKMIINGWSCLAMEKCALDEPYVSVPTMMLIQATNDNGVIKYCEKQNADPCKRRLCKVETAFLWSFINQKFENDDSLENIPEEDCNKWLWPSGAPSKGSSADGIPRRLCCTRAAYPYKKVEMVQKLSIPQKQICYDNSKMLSNKEL